ncbi:MAG: hypothetical protein ACTHKL_24690 [Streptosporangiaceae bacterium]
MLNHIWTADAALSSRALSRTGASFTGSCAAVSRERAETAVASKAAATAVVAGMRPHASASAVSFGNAAHAAGKANLALQQRTSQKKYARTTRIATQGGGAMGPHPAWDPV